MPDKPHKHLKLSTNTRQVYVKQKTCDVKMHELQRRAI